MTSLTYLFDPLCGWCHGALSALGQHDAARRGARPDNELLRAFAARVQIARDLMERLGLNGVPALLLGTERALPNALLYGPHATLLATVGEATA
jgi:protein-disulfide isomerase-like protein with CxxC motif